jgi:hypothetical protein
VLLLASPRSGTTLLGMLLDLHPEVCFVGELSHYQTSLANDVGCPCGEAISQCALWSVVGAAPAWDEAGSPSRRDAAAAVTELQVEARRPVAVLGAAMGRPSAAQRRYIDYLDRLRVDLARETGARVVVDTSKRNLVEVLLRARIGSTPIEVVHLHRDPRGVVMSRLTSWRRSWADSSTPRGVVARVGWPIVLLNAWRWTRVNATALALTRRLRRGGRPTTRMAYEELIAQPQKEIGRLLTELHLDAHDAAEAWVAPDQAVMVPNHSIRGNRVRHSTGALTMSVDDRWRHDLPRSMQLAVLLLTAPVRTPLGR